MTKNVGVIAGATGAASKRLVEVLLADPDWRVIGLSRNPPKSDNPRLVYRRADLTDAANTRGALAEFPDATHVFYTARAKFTDATVGVEDVEGNATMVRNLVDAGETACKGLQHVHLVEGTKWYGMHLGAFPTPAREDDPRHMPPNFYYAQEDILIERQKGRKWTWSSSRPGFLYDFAPERPRNLIAIIGAWAAMCQEAGIPLDFPGRQKCYDAMFEATDATQLARGIKWMATAENARNQAYNLVDGTTFRWNRLWPRIAKLYGLQPGIVRNVQLTRWMADKEPMWQRIVKRRGLKPSRIEDVAVWGFGDFCWGLEHDVVSSVAKIRGHGFHDTVDTEEQILAHLTRYREAKILP
jgi:nucleoside-diphosphate-sugar epimerase